jgi:hypothetical protein
VVEMSQWTTVASASGSTRPRCGHSTRRSTLRLAVVRIVIDELTGK